MQYIPTVSSERVPNKRPTDGSSRILEDFCTISPTMKRSPLSTDDLSSEMATSQIECLLDSLTIFTSLIPITHEEPPTGSWPLGLHPLADPRWSVRDRACWLVEFEYILRFALGVSLAPPVRWSIATAPLAPVLCPVHFPQSRPNNTKCTKCSRT